jgi:hypothetical protein
MTLRIMVALVCLCNVGAKTLSITTLSKRGLYVTLSICDSQNNNALLLCLSVAFYYYYAEWHYAECGGAIMFGVSLKFCIQTPNFNYFIHFI